MLNSLQNDHFFSEQEIARLHALSLWQASHTSPAKLAFAALILTPIMQIDQLDGMTSPSEFTVIGEFVRRIEREFQLATEEDLESIGTDMGMLPMVGGGWKTPQFVEARMLLAAAIDRLSEPEAQNVRNVLAQGVLQIARAGSGHIINLHKLPASQKPTLNEIVIQLKLGNTSEGLRILEFAAP